MSAKKKVESPVEERIAYILPRLEGETWLDAALRQAPSPTMKQEVKHSYDKYVENEMAVEKAAWQACYDWDLLEKFNLDKT